jgi:hypothetical protein
MGEATRMASLSGRVAFRKADEKTWMLLGRGGTSIPAMTSLIFTVALGENAVAECIQLEFTGFLPER